MLKQSNAELRAILARLVAVAPGAADAGRFNGAKMILFKNDLTPGQATELADLTVPEFTGYAMSAAIVWGAAFTNDLGNAQVVGGTIQFTVTTPFATAETIFGYGVVNAAGDGLLWCERFATPIDISAAGQAIPVVPSYVLGR